MWLKSKRLIALAAIVFLSIEVNFFAANLTKVVHGGWLPLAFALLVFMALVTSRRGQEIVTANRSREEGPLREFVEHLDARDFPVVRVPGTAVFLHANPKTTPLATMRLADRMGLLEGACDFDNASYFISQITIVPGDAPGMSRWHMKLFLTLAHNAADPVQYFRLPDNRTVTMGQRGGVGGGVWCSACGVEESSPSSW